MVLTHCPVARNGFICCLPLASLHLFFTHPAHCFQLEQLFFLATHPISEYYSQLLPVSYSAPPRLSASSQIRSHHAVDACYRDLQPHCYRFSRPAQHPLRLRTPSCVHAVCTRANDCAGPSRSAFRRTKSHGWRPSIGSLLPQGWQGLGPEPERMHPNASHNTVAM